MPFPRRCLAPLVLSGALWVAACGAPRGDGAAETSSGFRGVLTAPPRAKPDFTLPDAAGAPFDFRRATEGQVALLFFGYTHCPDVCPLHVANVAAVLQRLPPATRARIRFVFVTTDPARDTPARLTEWLGQFDPSFVGLRGSEDEVNRILYQLRMPPIQRDAAAAGGAAEYQVGHAAQVVAFGLDGLARLEYPFGIRQEDWAHDLPRLARGELPQGAEAAPAAAPGAGAGAAAPPAPGRIEVAAAVVPQPATASEGALYLVLRNGGPADTLQAVASDAVAGAMLHAQLPADGTRLARMAPVASLPVGPGGTLALLPGGHHVMLTGFAARPAVGTTLAVRLRFARAGEVAVAANVVAYADVERLLAAARTALAP